MNAHLKKGIKKINGSFDPSVHSVDPFARVNK